MSKCARCKKEFGEHETSYLIRDRDNIFEVCKNCLPKEPTSRPTPTISTKRKSVHRKVVQPVRKRNVTTKKGVK